MSLTKYQTDAVIEFQALFATFKPSDLTNIFAIEDNEDHRQSITGRFVGNKLDNAMGNYVDARAILKGYQEFLLYIETADLERPNGSVFLDGTFNVATLIAIIRSNGKFLKSVRPDFTGTLFFLDAVTFDANDEFHEPDNQGISGSIYGSADFQFAYFPTNKRCEFMISRETAHPEYGVKSAAISIETLIEMMLLIKI